MIEFPCTLVCEGCGARKPGTAALDAATLLSLLTSAQTMLNTPTMPFRNVAYDIDETVGEQASWRIIGPGTHVVCGDVCYKKLFEPAMTSAPESPVG